MSLKVVDALQKDQNRMHGLISTAADSSSDHFPRRGSVSSECSTESLRYSASHFLATGTSSNTRTTMTPAISTRRWSTGPDMTATEKPAVDVSTSSTSLPTSPEPKQSKKMSEQCNQNFLDGLLFLAPNSTERLERLMQPDPFGVSADSSSASKVFGTRAA